MIAGLLDSLVQHGSLYAISALGIALSLRVLNWPDLTVDGSFTLGGAISATLLVGGVGPVTAIVTAFAAGAMAGTATFGLHRKLGISKILSGILIMMVLYSINLRIMGGANVSLLQTETVFSPLELLENGDPVRLLSYLAIGFVTLAAVVYLLLTRLGLFIRATGDNEFMVLGLGINTDGPLLIGMAFSNALVAVSGALVAQNQGFADVSMGTGLILIGLASLIIGEVVLSGGPTIAKHFSGKSLSRLQLFPWRSIAECVAAVLGAFIYFAIVALCLEIGLQATDLKLATGLLVIAGIAVRWQGPVIETYTRGKL